MYQIYQELMRARGRQQVHLNALCKSMPVLHSRHNAFHCMIYRSYIIIYIIIYDHISRYTELHFNTVAAFYSCHNTFHCMINSALLSCSTPPWAKTNALRDIHYTVKCWKLLQCSMCIFVQPTLLNPNRVPFNLLNSTMLCTASLPLALLPANAVHNIQYMKCSAQYTVVDIQCMVYSASYAVREIQCIGVHFCHC